MSKSSEANSSPRELPRNLSAWADGAPGAHANGPLQQGISVRARAPLLGSMVAGSERSVGSNGSAGLCYPPAFVISGGCCGAKLLASALRMHSDILSVEEFFGALGGAHVLTGSTLPAGEFWERLLHFDPELRGVLSTVGLPELTKELRTEGASTLSPLELVTLPRLTSTPSTVLANLRAHLLERPAAVPRGHSDALFAWLCGAARRRHWVECSVGSVEYVADLVAHWPQAKLVYLVRDGRDAACEMAVHPIFRVRVARMLARDPSLPVRDCLEAAIPVHHYAASWSDAMLRAEPVLRERARGDVHLLRYELLVHASSLELDRVAHFLTGERAPPGWLTRCARIMRHTPSRWSKLPASERTELEAACRPGMECLRRLVERL